MTLFAKPSKTDAYGAELTGWFIGAPLKVRRGVEGHWFIDIGTDWAIGTHQWRLVGARSIIVTSDDDGHQFDLTAPVDAEVSVNKAVAGLQIAAVALDASTGDLTLSIGDAMRLELLTWSSAYEMWQLWRKEEFYGAVGSGGLR